MTLLNDKIGALRAPYEPSTAMGELYQVTSSS